MGSPNAMWPSQQQVCVLDVAVCVAVAANTSGALTPQSETNTNAAAAMNLVFIPILQPVLEWHATSSGLCDRNHMTT